MNFARTGNCMMRRISGVTSALRSTNIIGRRSYQTAGILVIGDEVLKGQVRDTNSGFLAKELHKRGYKLQSITVIPDDVNVIKDSVRSFSQKFNVVITTGGIGPTHDDVTYEAIAQAFNDTLFYHPSLLEKCKQHYKTEDTSHPGFKMVYIPKSSLLNFGKDASGKITFWLPVVSVENVFIFPGVPHLCEKLFTTCQIFPVAGQFHNRAVYLNTFESTLTPKLNEAVSKFPDVIFGSYPTFFHSYYTVKLTLQSDDRKNVEEAEGFLRDQMPWVVNYDENFLEDGYKKLINFENKHLIATISRIKNIIDSKSFQDIYLYFDGGKNSTLLLHLMTILSNKKNLNVIYVERNKGVTRFVENISKTYNANLLKFDTITFERFLKSDPNLLLIKGTRLSDPDSQAILSFFDSFNTYNPLSDWEYRDVWDVVRGLYLPYCELYNRGFSSLSKSVNPKLITEGPRKDVINYKNASLLEDPSFE